MAKAPDGSTRVLNSIRNAYVAIILVHRDMETYENCPEIFLELCSELEIIRGVLESLQGIIRHHSTILSELEAPLSRCENTCRDFLSIIPKFESRSNGKMAIASDWTRLSLKEDDVAEFMDKLKGFKSTFETALGGAVLLTTTSTAEELKEFKEVVVEKIAGLQTSIRKLDTKRQSDPDAAEREWIQAEQEQIEECISLYTSLFEHVEMAQRKLQGDNFSDQEVLLPKIKVFQNFRTKKITADQLEDIKSAIARQTTRLEDVKHDLESSSDDPNQQDLEADYSFLCQLRDQVQERINKFEDVRAGMDSSQVIASTTPGHIIHARKVSADKNAFQALGQLPESCLNQLSQNHHENIQKIIEQQNDHKMKLAEAQGSERYELFEQYGTGRKLR